MELLKWACTHYDIESDSRLRQNQEDKPGNQSSRQTSSNTFSSNFSPSLVFSAVGENKVHPDNNLSPSSRTRETHVAIASVRIFDKRMRSRGSVDCNFNKNSEKTDRVRKPSV
jgi:hypothetical protein